jgi:ATP synthase protein I
MDKNNSDNNENSTNGYLKYSGMAMQMIVIIGVFAYAGYKIDDSARHATRWVTAILSLIGVFIAMYVVIKSLKN